MSRIGRYLLYGVVVLARIGGRYEPCWPVICCTAWLLWPVSVAAVSRTGRYLLREVAVLARIGGHYEPYWPFLLCGMAVLARIGGRYDPYWALLAA